MDTDRGDLTQGNIFRKLIHMAIPIMGSQLLQMSWSKLSTARLQDDRVEIQVVHPFSPLNGKRYEVIEHMVTWGEDRVLCIDENGETRLILTSWTDYLPVDPFIQVSNGTADFKYDDLQLLAQFLRAIKKC